MQLTEWTERFADLGVGVTGMTYDSLEIVASFHAEQALNFPLLHDDRARNVLAFDVLNEAYPAGDENYGLPDPGIIYIDGSGVVRAKFAIPGYRDRPPMADVYATVAALITP